jgi:serine/threonine-protein kinase
LLAGPGAADTGSGEIPSPPPGLALEGELGRGGMGRVFRARHLKLERPVAVKFLPPDLVADPVFEERFEREARLLARLSHPNIVGVHDFGVTDDGSSYLVMELVSGGTLSDRLPLAPQDAVRVALDLCAGLAYAHDKGMVHRDVKPANVLFDDQGRAKLADFGIARLVDLAGAGDPLTSPSQVVGTPDYMAPEARAGGQPDPRTDLFAVGILLHQMITGRLAPASGIARRGPMDGVPEPIAAVIRRATAPNPRDRPANAGDLSALLSAARDAVHGAPTRPTAARPAPEPLPPDELSWQRAAALALAGATAIALYALLISVTPRIMDPGDHVPFIVLGADRLPDGRLFTRARFEVWPTLAAAGAFALAFAAYGLLRRHWRHAGLDVPTPDRPLPGTSGILRLAFVLNGLFVARLGLERTAASGIVTYVPVIGGVLELVMVYRVWLAVLEARRTSRPLRRETLLWVGLLLSLLPPAVSLLQMLSGRGP